MSNINITSTNQSGGITAHTVNIGPTARSMNDQFAQKFEQELKQELPTGAKITVSAVLGDAEAHEFAHQVLKWLHANGYATATGVDIIHNVHNQQLRKGMSLINIGDSQFNLVVGTCETPVQPTIIKRDWAKPSPVQPANITYNVNGTGARVNINSTDSSVNVISAEVTKVFSQAREAVSKISDPTARLEIGRAVDEMENAHGSGNFPQKYQAFITSAANHMSVLAPIIQAVSGLLT